MRGAGSLRQILGESAYGKGRKRKAAPAEGAAATDAPAAAAAARPGPPPAPSPLKPAHVRCPVCSRQMLEDPAGVNSHVGAPRRRRAWPRRARRTRNRRRQPLAPREIRIQPRRQVPGQS